MLSEKQRHFIVTKVFTECTDKSNVEIISSLGSLALSLPPSVYDSLTLSEVSVLFIILLYKLRSILNVEYL